jgi:predicted nucleic acid-binding protein
VTLVDTSIWVDHLRCGNAVLQQRLVDGMVLTHPFIVGELACGHLRARDEVLGLLRALPAARVVEHDEMLDFIERHGLAGRGIGWIDAHLLASARLAHAGLWTLDRALSGAAERAGVVAAGVVVYFLVATTVLRGTLL